MLWKILQQLSVFRTTQTNRFVHVVLQKPEWAFDKILNFSDPPSGRTETHRELLEAQSSPSFIWQWLRRNSKWQIDERNAELDFQYTEKPSQKQTFYWPRVVIQPPRRQNLLQKLLNSKSVRREVHCQRRRGKTGVNWNRPKNHSSAHQNVPGISGRRSHLVECKVYHPSKSKIQDLLVIPQKERRESWQKDWKALTVQRRTGRRCLFGPSIRVTVNN